MGLRDPLMNTFMEDTRADDALYGGSLVENVAGASSSSNGALFRRTWEVRYARLIAGVRLWPCAKCILIVFRVGANRSGSVLVHDELLWRAFGFRAQRQGHTR